MALGSRYEAKDIASRMSFTKFFLQVMKYTGILSIQKRFEFFTAFLLGHFILFLIIRVRITAKVYSI